eukprot:TRINITY_DN5135_c0_g1_i1.p1 TRINITY_DN5135_c0_g1~~TRINITY_DN5135_c0_g1_i1.p1  ORF type:complete len:125 (-),score=31.74 TRINITY_DN5135_c0_g1_i1:77-451(-)
MSEDAEVKKGGMRTETDVFNRIKWDEELQGLEFSVGYSSTDKVTGEKIIAECPLDEFPVGIVPMHVIKYFKYQDTVVWDRPNQIDNFFGSMTVTQRAQGVQRTTIFEIIRQQQADNDNDVEADQ